MKDIEIMSPVGSFESLVAAIQGGADAVYFGVGKLNMRSRSAKRFSLDDLDHIADICRQHQINSYLTINTIIYDHELEEMRATIRRAKQAGVTAVIASDIAVMQYARQQDVRVHISTQCNITNVEAVRFYAQFGDVMVLARELTLEQVHAISGQIEAQDIRGPSGRACQAGSLCSWCALHGS